MFYSLIQTLVCVLLINGGLYALHLKGSGNDESHVAKPLLLPGLSNSRSVEHIQHAGGYKQSSSAGAYANAGRLSEELADLAQLERERLMLLGIAKQTAAGTGHHGRPIITGRIHMSPTDDVVAEGELAGVLMPPPARGYTFGHVVKQPAQQNDDGLDFAAAEFAGGGGGIGLGLGAPSEQRNYEYGRIVKPAIVPEYDTQQMPLDLEAFMELDPDPKSDEDDFDLDSYQYLEELLAEQQQREWKQEKNHHAASNPYQSLENIDGDTSLGLRELFNKEQQNANYKHKNHQQHQQQLQQQQQQQKHHQQQQQQQLYLAEMRNGYNPSNIRLQQKWLRKRAQQKQLQQQLHQQSQRNIFDQKNHDNREESIAVPHYFNQRHHSLLSFVNSEATANKNNNNKNRGKVSSVMDETTMNTRNNHNSNQLEELQDEQKQQQEQQEQLEQKQSSASSSSPSSSLSLSKKTDDVNNSKQDIKQNASGISSLSNVENSSKQQQQQQQQQHQIDIENKSPDEFIVHPNHKRSGIGSNLLAPILSAAGSHSMASQLMLRTARGQRQYDVPQIGKSSI